MSDCPRIFALGQWLRSVLVVAPSIALATTAFPAEPIKIGAYGSLTGKEATWGQSYERGVRLGLEDVNAAGGVLGRPLQILFEDNQSKPGESATAVRKLLSRDKVVAVLGEVSSGRSLEAAAICQQAKVPMISSGSAPKLTQVGTYIFRAHFIDPFQGTVMAQFARTKLNARRVALLTEATNAYSVGLAKFFAAEFTSGGGTIIVEQKYSSAERDFKAQLTAIKATRADALFVPGYYTEAGLIVAQARQLGLEVPILGGDGWSAPELLRLGGPALRNTYYCDNFSTESKLPETQRFISHFRARYAGFPDGVAADAYDTVLMLADAITRAGGPDPQKIRDALATTRNLAGVGGPLTINEQRDQLKPAYILGFKDGDYHLNEIIRP
ncbi:MAG: ABC transporter substrate-binding protein [Opitutus sp.]